MEIWNFPYTPTAPAGWVWRTGVLVGVLCAISGCAHRSVEPRVVPVSTMERAQPVEPALPAEGVHHSVVEGQTLWRIARAYGLTVDELMRVNGISDPTDVAVGTLLFVPRAHAPIEVPAHPARPMAADAGTEIEAGGDWAWPVRDGAVLSYFGARRAHHRHKGLDIRGRLGQPVRATRDGRVTYSGSGMRGYGKTVIVDHGNGFTSLYAHNSRLRVRTGQRVRQGETIAEVGRTGNATGEHCHFEIRRRDVPVDPMQFFSQTSGAAR